MEVPEAGIPAAGNDWLIKKVSTQKHTEDDKLIEGTYVHADLIPHIASWVSPSFARMVSQIVNAHIVQAYKEKLQRSETKNEALKMEVDELHLRQEKTEKELATEHQKVECTDRDLSRWASTHAFTMMRLNEPGLQYPYYIIRCKRSEMKRAIMKVRAKHPHSILVYQQRYIPNAINLYHKLKDSRKVKTRRCYCLPFIEESQLIDLLGSFYSVPIKPNFDIN